MPTKQKRKKVSTKKMQKGSVGSFFVFGVLALLVVVGITAVGGLPPQSYPDSGQVVIAVTPTPDVTHNTLQLKTFGYITIAPTPVPSKSSLCDHGGANNEWIILTAFSPAPGQSVGNTGQIKVWVTDEGAPMIAPNEKIDLTTGQIISPGDRTAVSPTDGYLMEPALYIAPDTAESGAAHFPDYIKGQFNNSGQIVGRGSVNLQGDVTTGAPTDPLPAGSNPPGSNPNGFMPNIYTAEYIWNVSSLNLSTGTHQAEFSIHDGDRDRGVGCVSITIQ